ncbi:hypothetical protein [Myroides odoratus]|uniref:hypothetical protein n=1 Tax=Myroides odoratus TaxID=256 RepID=UPI0039B0CED8
MKNAVKTIILIGALVTTAVQVKAQVTVGSEIAPVQGALLDLKSYDDGTATNGGRNATKGLLLPRVELSNLNKLIISGEEIVDSQYGGNQYKAHIGLVVFNISTTAPFVPGLYVWDGSKWINTAED